MHEGDRNSKRALKKSILIKSIDAQENFGGW